jgi:hypothetical protein
MKPAQTVLSEEYAGKGTIGDKARVVARLRAPRDLLRLRVRDVAQVGRREEAEVIDRIEREQARVGRLVERRVRDGLHGVCQQTPRKMGTSRTDRCGVRWAHRTRSDNALNASIRVSMPEMSVSRYTARTAGKVPDCAATEDAPATSAMSEILVNMWILG